MTRNMINIKDEHDDEEEAMIEIDYVKFTVFILESHFIKTMHGLRYE